MNRRHLVLAVVLGATLIAAFFAPPPNEDVAVARAEPKASVGKQGSLESEPGLRIVSLKVNVPVAMRVIKRRIPDEEEADIFAAVSWVDAVKNGTKIVEETPPPPQAPPLPFKVIGLYSGEGAGGVFLQLNDQYLVVREGDTINGTYKIASYKNGSLDIVYLPMNQHQTLVVAKPE